MTPTISFHNVTKISVDAVTHFQRDAESGGEFWTRSVMLTDEDGGTFTFNLFSSSSADELAIGGLAPPLVSCECGYIGPDAEHTPPAPQPETEDPDDGA